MHAQPDNKYQLSRRVSKCFVEFCLSHRDLGKKLKRKFVTKYIRFFFYTPEGICDATITYVTHRK